MDQNSIADLYFSRNQDAITQTENKYCKSHRSLVGSGLRWLSGM